MDIPYLNIRKSFLEFASFQLSVLWFDCFVKNCFSLEWIFLGIQGHQLSRILGWLSNLIMVVNMMYFQCQFQEKILEKKNLLVKKNIEKL